MKRPPINFRRIRELIPPASVLRILGWKHVWEARGLLRGPCPIHGSADMSSRSLVVNHQVVYCHKCHWTGDAVALWANAKGLELDPYQAAVELCELLDVVLPILERRR